MKITNDYFDAQDLTQDTFLSAYKNLSGFDGKNEKAWLCRIATNKCLDYKRRLSRGQIPTEDVYFELLQDKESTTEEQLLDHEIKERLLECCKSLHPPYDEIAVLYFYDECTTAEIANKLNRNEKTVQTQMYRAKGMLKKLLGKPTNKKSRVN